MAHPESQRAILKRLVWHEVWLSTLCQPSVATFERILADPQAKPGRAYQWLVLSILIAVMVGTIIKMVITGPFFIGVLIPTVAYLGMLVGYFMGISFRGQMGFSLAFGIGIIAFIGLVFIGALGVLLLSALTQFIARRLGGQGTYGQLFYTQAAYTAPLGIVLAAVTPIAYVNLLSFPFFYIYAFILNLLALRAVNHFGWRSALGAAFIPGIVVGLIGCGLVLFSFVLLPFALVDR